MKDYNPLKGSAVPPTKDEIKAHIGSWWIQTGIKNTYQSYHVHDQESAWIYVQAHVACNDNEEWKDTWIWRPYFRETGCLRENWPEAAVSRVTKIFATVSIPHDGTDYVEV